MCFVGVLLSFPCDCATEQSDADVEDNVEQDTASRGRGVDVGESGYSSEKVGNEDSAVESPLPCLLNGDSALASPASPADIGGSVSPVGSADVAEMSSELVVTVPTSVSAVGSADVAEMSSELVVTIPTSPLESVGSPLSPSPVSSEVNVDCSSSVSAHAHMDCVSPDCNRPVSRFAFCNEDEMNNGDGVARLSPVEDTSGGTYNLPVSGLCEDISRLCTTFVPVPGLCADGCEAKQLVCGGGVGGIGDEVELHVNDVASEVYLSVNELNRKMIREVQSNGDVADNVLSSGAVADNVSSSGVMATQVQSSGIMANGMANWSATVLPRYQCDDGECSIQSCLNQFTALELMTGNNKVGCENCTRRQNQGKFECGNTWVIQKVKIQTQ